MMLRTPLLEKYWNSSTCFILLPWVLHFGTSSNISRNTIRSARSSFIHVRTFFLGRHVTTRA